MAKAETHASAPQPPTTQSLLAGLKDRLKVERSGKLKGNILSVEEMGSRDFYAQGRPDYKSEYDDRPGVAVTVAREGGETFSEFFHFPKQGGAVSGTKIGDFVAMYGDAPTPRMSVTIAPHSGLWKIVTALEDGIPVFRGK